MEHENLNTEETTNSDLGTVIDSRVNEQKLNFKNKYNGRI